MVFRRKSRSWRKRLSSESCSAGQLVAAMTRTSIGTGRLAPTGRGDHWIVSGRRLDGDGTGEDDDRLVATCLLAAYRDHCRPADYTLSAFGVDTAHTLTFRTGRRPNGCAVLVTESFHVIPQKPRVTGRRTCLRVRKTTSDVVADRCTPRGTVSLTKLAG